MAGGQQARLPKVESVGGQPDLVDAGLIAGDGSDGFALRAAGGMHRPASIRHPIFHRRQGPVVRGEVEIPYAHQWAVDADGLGYG